MKQRTALISGGTSGIGKGAVLQLLHDGFKVAAFSKDKTQCLQLKKELARHFNKNNFLVLTADVTDESSLKKAVGQTIKKFQSIDVLLNNAGLGYFARADKCDINKVQGMIQTNLIGMMRLTKLALPYMKKRRRGLILNISSISGKRANIEGEFYSAGKFGVMGYSEGLRLELREFGIKVATLCPGMIKTGFLDSRELARRKKIFHTKNLQMLNVEDISRIISLVCNQSENCDIQDITVMPFSKVYN